MLQSSRRILRLPTRDLDEKSALASNLNSEKNSGEWNIPDDVILEIVRYLLNAEILNLCLVAKRIHALLAPSLYSSVELRSNKQCRLVLKVFASRPELATLVRKLVVGPDSSSWAGAYDRDKSLKESEVAVSLEQLAADGKFEWLHTFRWEGVEAPHDGLWHTLKTHCPSLKDVGTTVGVKTLTENIDPESHLFSFCGLRGFSLTTQKIVRWPSLRTLEGRELPGRLWDMLIDHCPDLEELTLEGTCNTYQLWNVRKILSGRWPRLRSVSFGSLSPQELPSDDVEMVSFLSAHPTLTEIKLLSGMYYSRFSMFYLPALPHIYCFHGRMQQLKLAGGDLPALRCLQLTDWFSPSARFSEILCLLPHITSLSIYVNFLDSVNRPNCLALYQRVLSACPGLNHVEISATGPVILKDFSQAISCAPKLRSFIITRTRRLADEDMNASALRIAHQNPHLCTFTIRDVLDWDHNDQLHGHCRFRQIGTYHLLVDGEPRKAHSLRIHETGVNNLGRRYTRSSTSRLRH